MGIFKYPYLDEEKEKFDKQRNIPSSEGMYIIKIAIL